MPIACFALPAAGAQNAPMNRDLDRLAEQLGLDRADHELVRLRFGHACALRVRHLLEDPAVDARDAHPAWLPGHGAVVQLHPDADPPPDATAFAFWRIPGHKQLLHDGKGLALIARSPSLCQRYALAPGLEDGMAVAHAYRGRHAAPAAPMPGTPASMARPRPPPAALLELHTLQALDATLAGASLRDVAEGLFGADAAAGWYSDGGLRSKVRRLVRRGDALMRGGYRRLAQLPPLEKGRFEESAKRP